MKSRNSLESTRMNVDRRTFIAATGAALATPLLAKEQKTTSAFPTGFLWGAATAGHQVEGNNTASDTWFLENVKPTAFTEPSGDACNSFQLWPQDLDLVRDMG